MSDLANKTKEEPPARGDSKVVQRRASRAELVWEGKYDGAGRRVAPLRVALPFQTVETVNESAQDRQRNLQFGPGFRDQEWRNRLIWGDKKYVLPSLLAEYAGRVNLIYIDPPFDTGADFSFTATVPDHPDSEEDDSFTFTKEPSIIEHKAYRDIWGNAQTHLDAYLKWFYETAVPLHALLHENGSLHVQLDSGVSHYAKAILDELFGRGSFQNEIIWKRSSAHSDSKQGMSQYGRVTDTIFFYTKGSTWTWNQQFQPYGEDYVEAKYAYVDATGRRFKSTDLTAAKPGGETDYEWKGKRPPKGRYWAYSKANMEKMEAERAFLASSITSTRWPVSPCKIIGWIFPQSTPRLWNG
jgi:adenine-specific DNA-methyltransferase